MKVCMRANYASAEHGTCPAGKTIDLPDKEAKRLLEGGYAKPVDKPGQRKAVPPAETSEGEAGKKKSGKK